MFPFREEIGLNWLSLPSDRDGGEMRFSLHLEGNLFNSHFSKAVCKKNQFTTTLQNSHFSEFCTAVLQSSCVYENAGIAVKYICEWTYY